MKINIKIIISTAFAAFFFLCILSATHSDSGAAAGWGDKKEKKEHGDSSTPEPLPKPDSKLSPSDEQIEAAMIELREAEEKDRDSIRLKIEELVRQYPQSPLADDALLDVAKSYIVADKHDKAILSLDQISKNYPKGNVIAESKFLLGLAYFRQGECGQAAAIFSEIKKDSPFFADSSIFYIDCMLKAGKFAEAIDRYGALLKAAPNRAGEITPDFDAVFEKSDESVLKFFAEKLPSSPVSANVYYKLGINAYNRGDFEAAQKYLTQFIESHPGDTRSNEVSKALDEISDIGKIENKSIGLLMPLSGSWASYGKRFLDGATIAVGSFQPMANLRPPIRLEVQDTQEDPDITTRAAEDLIVNKKVIAIAGPIRQETAVIAAKIAQSYGVPIVTMTQKEDITNIGPMVFRNSVTPRDQARTLVWYAVTALGMSNFAILYPDNSMGQLFKDVFIEEAGKRGANVTLVIAYPPEKTDFRDEIQAVAKKRKDIQAIFIPDKYSTAVTMAPQFTFYNVVRVQLLGSSGWNHQKLIDLSKGQLSSIEGAVFPDVFFQDASSPIAKSFISDFEVAFGRKPGPYEAMGYETIRIIMERILQGKVKSRIEMRDALAGLKNFPTFSGYIAAQPDRSFHHQLFLLQVRGGRITDISNTGQF